MISLIRKCNKLLFLIALITLAITFFTQNSYRRVDGIHPAVLSEPTQCTPSSTEIIEFERDDYQYKLIPLYDYEINGLIVHKMDYRWFSIYKRDSVFPMDLCIMWGDNVANRVYQNKTLHFSQDCRFSMWHYQGHLNINGNEIANVHLLMNNDVLEKKIKTLRAGDQLRFKGKLVNVTAENTGEPGKYDPEKFTLHSSITRTDAGAGACEVLYIEDMKVLQKGNIISYSLFRACLYLLLVIIVINIVWFFIEVGRGFSRR